MGKASANNMRQPESMAHKEYKNNTIIVVPNIPRQSGTHVSAELLVLSTRMAYVHATFPGDLVMGIESK